MLCFWWGGRRNSELITLASERVINPNPNNKVWSKCIRQCVVGRVLSTHPSVDDGVCDTEANFAKPRAFGSGEKRAKEKIEKEAKRKEKEEQSDAWTVGWTASADHTNNTKETRGTQWRPGNSDSRSYNKRANDGQLWDCRAPNSWISHFRDWENSLYLQVEAINVMLFIFGELLASDYMGDVLPFSENLN